MSRKRYTAEQIIAMLREVEERTRYLGYDVNQFKILSTAVSGFFASLAGILLLLKNAIIGTEQLFMIFSGEMIGVPVTRDQKID